MATPAIANCDLTIHRSLGEPVDVGSGVMIEPTESVNLCAGDPFDIDELAGYQREELEDPKSRLSSLITRVSPMEAAARVEARLAAAEEGEVSTFGGGPGEVTLKQTRAPDREPEPDPEATLTRVDVREEGTEVTRGRATEGDVTGGGEQQ